jgi:CheY-like chemotaxis protein
MLAASPILIVPANRSGSLGRPYRQADNYKVPNARVGMKLQNKISLPESDGHMSPVESGGQTRVLLAEDDRALRRFLEVVLERAGYKVISAADGLEAMKVALSTPIDVVVTDAMMPNLSGHEFCRFLRNSQTLSHLPVILLSALERREANQSAEQADAFLSKPVSGESLIECIEDLLARKSK